MALPFQLSDAPLRGDLSARPVRDAIRRRLRQLIGARR